MKIDQWMPLIGKQDYGIFYFIFPVLILYSGYVLYLLNNIYSFVVIEVAYIVFRNFVKQKN